VHDSYQKIPHTKRLQCIRLMKIISLWTYSFRFEWNNSYSFYSNKSTTLWLILGHEKPCECKTLVHDHKGSCLCCIWTHSLGLEFFRRKFQMFSLTNDYYQLNFHQIGFYLILGAQSTFLTLFTKILLKEEKLTFYFNFKGNFSLFTNMKINHANGLLINSHFNH
jgi:hypothetical protein